MSEHTPGALRVQTQFPTLFVMDENVTNAVASMCSKRTDGGSVVSDEEAQANARRMVLCWNTHDAMLAAYDSPDMFNSCPQRFVTTTPLQSLLAFNGDWSLARAQALAARIDTSSDVPLSASVQQVFLLALSRPPTAAEHTATAAFFAAQASDTGASATEASDTDGPGDAWIDFCHVLLCSNEFVYVD